jgi:grpE
MAEKEFDEKVELENENIETENQQNETDNETKETADENVENKEETCEEKIAKLELEVQEWKNSYTRKLAEFQNFTKRKETEVSEMKKYASEGIIVKLLDNIDNLERAENASAETKNFDALVEGVNMILRNLKYMLSEEGVEEIEAGEGVKFNPYEHQAMMTEEKDDLDNDVIVQVFQKGYKLKGKVIRPAMVTVNKK